VKNLDGDAMNRTFLQDDETLARQICERRELDGHCFAPGAFVAIAEGRVVGVGSTFDEADALLVASGRQPGEGMICEVRDEETDVIRCRYLTCL
jgi:hypothetical protein